MLITPYDLLHPAGEPVTLEVEVEHRWGTFIDPAAKDVEVEVEGVGRARTAFTGIATFALGTLPPGTHHPVVRMGRRSVEALIRVIPADTPLIIIDIDQTIADVTPQGFIFRATRSVRAMPGSHAALQEIATSMQIVYLTARDHIFTRKTKLWLRSAAFPEAPVYLRKGSRFWSASPREHKLERLKELRARFPNIRWGIGDKPGDAAAYAAHSIRPILLSKCRLPEVSTDVPCLPDWKTILEHVKKG
jgi:hypothetical protein